MPETLADLVLHRKTDSGAQGRAPVVGLVDKGKIFNDIIHGNIKLDGILLEIVDTPQFQRLHFLKQLGTADFVFRLNNCASIVILFSYNHFRAEGQHTHDLNTLLECAIWLVVCVSI